MFFSRFTIKSSDLINPTIVVLVTMNIAIFFFNNESQLEKIFQNASAIHKELEFKIQEGCNAVTYLNSSGKILLNQPIEIKSAHNLEYRINQDFYGLNEQFNSHIPKNDRANITGFYGMKNDYESKKEIEMTLLMSPMFKAIKEQNSDYAWVYYISNKDFMTLYPYKTFDEVHYKKEYSNEPIIRYARPEVNPDKKLFFTPIYRDGGGLGLMVTIGMPLYHNDKFLGTFDLDITLNSISQLIKQQDYLNNKSIVINKENQIIGAHNISGINLTSDVVLADKLFDTTLLKHKDTKDKLAYFNGDYIFVGSFSNAPWKYIYYKSLASIYFKSFLYTIPIWIFILFLLQIRRLIKELEISQQKVHQAHQHTKESIEYASLIQTSLIPESQIFRKYFNDYFVLWHPKDIVGGDIYFCEELREKDECLLMIIDCTGHGVPGAFVTMLVKAIERQIVSKINHNENEIVSPSEILSVFNQSIKYLLKQERKGSISNAGFDGQIVYYNKKEKIIKCASARNSIFYVQDDEVIEIKGDRHSIGYKESNLDFQFIEHTIDLTKETTIYLSTDGYWDQMGGEHERSFGKKRLKTLIENIKNEPMAEQQEEFIYTLRDYQGNVDRQDDITIVAFKIK